LRLLVVETVKVKVINVDGEIPRSKQEVIVIPLGEHKAL
jgi:hypothetical protein